MCRGCVNGEKSCIQNLRLTIFAHLLNLGSQVLKRIFFFSQIIIFNYLLYFLDYTTIAPFPPLFPHLNPSIYIFLISFKSTASIFFNGCYIVQECMYIKNVMKLFPVSLINPIYTFFSGLTTCYRITNWCTPLWERLLSSIVKTYLLPVDLCLQLWPNGFSSVHVSMTIAVFVRFMCRQSYW